MEEQPESPVPLAVTGSSQQALDWELALIASGIRARRQDEGSQWSIVVADADFARAHAVLAEYEKDGQRTAPAIAPLEYGATYAAFVVAASLVAFYAYLAKYDVDQAFFWHGNASAERILWGEIWRTVTALTLHADAAHVAGNALFCAVFGSAVFRALGPGLGLCLLLLAGAGGNFLDALWRGPPNIAVGASTAVFGGVGILGGLRFMNRYRVAESRQRAWVALAATLGLLAVLGAAPGTDILAHLFGLVVGIGLGIAAAVRLQHPPGVVAQVLLGGAASAVVCLCWAIALR